MNTHAKYPPSSASRWMTCPGSVHLIAKCNIIDSIHSEASAMGTTIHAMGEYLLLNNGNFPKVRVPISEWGGNRWGGWADVGDFNNNEVTTDMTKQARDYYDAVQTLRSEGDEMRVEVRAKLNDNLYGTADCVLIDDDMLTVIDLKTGHGIVSPDENVQLLTYAGMVMSEMKHMPDKVRLVIIQPPHIGSEVKIWETQAAIVMRHMVSVGIAMESTDIVPGEVQCQWCPAQTKCTSLIEHTHSTVSVMFDDMQQSDKRKLLDNEKLILNLIKACKTEATELLNQGNEYPGYKLVHAITNRKWNEGAESVLRNELKHDEMYVTKLIGVMKGDELLGKELMETLTSKPEGKLTLVPDTDRRDAVSIAKEFPALAGE